MTNKEDFNKALELLKEFVEIPNNREYDGIIVKKLMSSNTLDKGTKAKTTHIAITGEQMDMFPYLRADKYFECDHKNIEGTFKKYLFLRLPFYLYETNINKLEENSLIKDTTNSVIEAYCCVTRRRCEAQGEQIQLSLIKQDSPEFVAFRKMLHTGDYLVICKIKNRVAYDCFGIKASEAINGDRNVEVLNGKFFYLPTLTAVEEKDLVVSNENIIFNTDDFVDNESEFKEWFKTQTHDGDKLYKDSTQSYYVSSLRFASKELSDKIQPYKTIFNINDISEFQRIRTIIESDEDKKEVFKTYGGGSLKPSLDLYQKFLEEKRDGIINADECSNYYRELIYNTNVTSNYPLNRIIFGAPGTGKSHKLADEMIGIESYERVTFHPDYTYANFVGTYKPVPAKDEAGKDIITYKYVPGSFMRMLVKALLNPEQAHLLIIEEINRANVAAVFGDVFQLLDRDANGVSEYAIQTSEDMRGYLSEALNVDVSKVESIKIPNNLFLWATMNSADQGVYPMDTAFKRRWDFEYIDIDNNDKDINHYWFEVAGAQLHWNSLRKAINKGLTDNGINEDKLMGAFFVSKNVIDENNNEKFVEAFCNKVIMYLFEDAARQKPGRIFELDNAKTRYSALCKDFEKNGINIFVANIVEEYKKLAETQVTTTNQEQTVETAETVE